MNEQGLGGFGGGRGREAMALLQHHHHQRRRQLQLEEEEEEVRRQMFGGVAAFPAALGHGQQVVEYGEDAGGLGDSDAGGSEPEPPSERTRGGSGTKRSRAAEVHNLSEKRRRSKINEKMKALQSLIPDSNKTDKASMLDEAIEYLKQLQLQVQMLSMRNGVYLNPPPYLSGAIEPAQASQMFAALGGGNITASSSRAVMPPVNQSSGVHQAFDPLNPPRNQPLSFVLPNVDKTIQEAPFHLESSQSHLRTFRISESSEMMLQGEVVAKHQLTSTEEKVSLTGIDMNPIRQESSIVNTDPFDGCSHSKE